MIGRVPFQQPNADGRPFLIENTAFFAGGRADAPADPGQDIVAADNFIGLLNSPLTQSPDKSGNVDAQRTSGDTNRVTALRTAPRLLGR